MMKLSIEYICDAEGCDKTSVICSQLSIRKADAILRRHGWMISAGNTEKRTIRCPACASLAKKSITRVQPPRI